MHFPPVISSPSWSSAWTTLRARALSLTCADASRIVAAWTWAASEAAWPLWYQFGAVAYGWDPERDVLDTSAAQAARPYPLADELWESLRELAAGLDAAAPDPLPYTVHLQFDQSPTWSSPTWLSLLRGALVEDGARARLVSPVASSADSSSWLLVLVVGAVWLLDTPRRSRSRSR